MFKKLVTLSVSTIRMFSIVSILGFLVFYSFNTRVNADDISTKGKTMKLLIWGDSLSAAYGIPVEKGWVNLLRSQLGKQVEVTNASISGETTQGGLVRLPEALDKHKPDIMLLELGANDGLRGISTTVMHKNLDDMITLAREQDITVILLGIKIPPNYGSRFTQKFEAVFTDLAEHYQLSFVPFILQGVAMDYDLMQEDGLHPNVKAQPIILKNILPALEGKMGLAGVKI